MSAPLPVPAVPADRHGRLAPDPELLQAIALAAAKAWPRPAQGPGRPSNPSHPWRFSGRWWAAPLPLRRERP